MKLRTSAGYALGVLFAVNALNFFDRQIAGVVAEPIRREWGLTDTQMGLLGTAFTLLYAATGVPLGRLTDKAVRTRILTFGVFVWSIFTAGSGLARNYAQLFITRLGVGIGESTCAPASSSLIGDLFPANRRAKALSIFMLGLPIGIALSSGVAGWVTQVYGWRNAFYVAGLPGILCGIAVLFIQEPKRGASEIHDIGAQKRAGSPYRLVLSIPTMWWLIASGALHNFNMYAIGQFLNPFLVRFHGLGIRDASLVLMVVYGLCGVPGLLIGGYIGDAIMKRQANGRLLVGAVAIAASAPLMFLGLGRPSGDITGLMVSMGLGIGAMYVYYSTVYSTIQDVIEPSLRGTAMALYFFAMYVLGASLGPLGTGLASDYFTRQAASRAGIEAFTQKALEPFRADGLHNAMYIVPILGVLLALVLWAGSRTVTGDMERLQKWMRESVSGVPVAETAEEETVK